MAVTVRELEVLFNKLSKLGDAAEKASEKTIELQARFAGMEKDDKDYAKVKRQLGQSQKKEKELKVETNRLTRQQNQLVGENTQAFKTLVENIDSSNVAIIISADHSTPCINKGHSDDPVPVVVSADFIKNDGTTRMTEEQAKKGSIGF